MTLASLRPPPGPPCKSCPFRRDTPPGTWPPTTYLRLPKYDGGREAQIASGTMPMFCYTQPAYLCGGWIACFGADKLAALSYYSDKVVWWLARNYQPGTPIFTSGAEAAEHGLKFRGEGLPDGQHERGDTLIGVRQQLARRKRIDVDALAEEIVAGVQEWAKGEVARLDQAAKILSASPVLGRLPAAWDDALRPRHCIACGECPQFRPAGEPWETDCRCGHAVGEHSFQSYRQLDKERSQHGKTTPASTSRA